MIVAMALRIAILNAGYLSYSIDLHWLQKPRGVGSPDSWFRPHDNCANTIWQLQHHATPHHN